MNEKTAATTKPGIDIGITTLTNRSKKVAPSMMADSSILRGISPKNPRRIQITKGRLKLV